MTDKQLFVKLIGNETPIFARVFRALPTDKLHHTHHVKSKTAEQLMTQMASESLNFMQVLRTGKVDFAKHEHVEADTEKVATVFTNAFNETRDYVAQMSEHDWEGKAVAGFGEKVEWESTKGEMLWGLLLDLIHHRGQLSTYIRPMGGKVPSIYGPSGDSQQD